MRKKLPTLIKSLCLLLCVITTQNTIAQTAPGGVTSGLSLWLKAEEDFTYNNATNAQWLDQSSNSYVLNSNLVLGSDGISSPTYSSNSINFNSGITFDGIDTGLSTGTNITGFDYSQWSAFSVQTIADPNVSNCVWHYSKPSNTFALFIDPNSTGFNIAVNNTSDGLITTPLLNDSKPYIVGYAADNQSSATYVNNKTVHSGSGKSSLPGDGAFMVGLDADGGEGVDGDNHLDGDVGEIIIYNQKLSEIDRQKVSSYLSIKYGITLDQTTVTNYIDSNGTTIWDASSNLIYTNDVFGIGTDSNSGLTQKVSQSANNSNSPIISTTQHFTQPNTDGIRTVSLETGSFLMMGHNNEAEAFNLDYNGETNNRYSRVWKLDKTGVVNSVFLAIPKAAYNFPSGIPILIQSNDEAFVEDVIEIELNDDGTHYWAQIDPTVAQYVTFASTFTLSLENNQYSVFTVYPNPAVDEVVILFDKHNNSEVQIELYNFTGKKVMSKKINTSLGYSKFDITNLTSGVYILKINNGKHLEVNKLIKK